MERAAPVILFAALLAVWELAARTGMVSRLFFPEPSAILWRILQLFSTGELLRAVAITLQRVLLGLLIGGVPGMVLGLVMGTSRRMRIFLDPFVAALHPIPKIAIFPLVMIIFGIGEVSKVAVVALSAFFPMLINSMAGVLEINPTYFEVASNYGAGTARTLRRIVIPASLPMILAGVRLALNIALLVTIAVELVSSRAGLGAMIWLSWETLRTEQLYASLTVIGALGIGFNYALGILSSVVIPWRSPEKP